jgi:hypothetical protein
VRCTPLPLGGLLLAIGACGFLPRPGTSRSGAEIIEQASKPAPVAVPMGDCGLAGSAPDRTINILKNRGDEGAWRDVPWTTIAHLPWPRAVGFRFRNLWTADQREEVARYEGAPVRIEGYLNGFKLEGREPPNCYSSDPARRDYHLWLTENPSEGRKQAVVVEITPRIRVQHAQWTEAHLDSLVRSQSRVRVSGWLMLDQMHPERVGLNRITLWEVHPIMHIDVQQTGRWVSIDSVEDTWRSNVTQAAQPDARIPTTPHLRPH